MIQSIVLLMVVSLFSAPSFAQNPPSLEQIKQTENLENLLDTLQQAELSLEIMTRRRRSDCTKAIGYAPFCDCVTKELPVAWGFSDYITITTRTKEENGYDKLDADLQDAYDMVSPIRDKCIKIINQKP